MQLPQIQKVKRNKDVGKRTFLAQLYSKPSMDLEA